MHIQSPGIIRTDYSSTFKDIQAYSGILMHIQPHTWARYQGGRAETSLFVFLTKCLSKCPSSTTSPALKNFWCHTCNQELFFLQNASCLTVFSIQIYLDNCSVMCTVTLCYVLRQTYPVFWHIQYSIFFQVHASIFNNINRY